MINIKQATISMVRSYRNLTLKVRVTQNRRHYKVFSHKNVIPVLENLHKGIALLKNSEDKWHKSSKEVPGPSGGTGTGHKNCERQG